MNILLFTFAGNSGPARCCFFRVAAGGRLRAAGPAALCAEMCIRDRYMAYTVIGDVVNTASRLEDNAPPGEIYISPVSYTHLDVYKRQKRYPDAAAAGHP